MPYYYNYKTDCISKIKTSCISPENNPVQDNTLRGDLVAENATINNLTANNIKVTNVSNDEKSVINNSFLQDMFSENKHNVESVKKTHHPLKASHNSSISFVNSSDSKILLLGQSDPLNNGVYYKSTLTRADGFKDGDSVGGHVVFVHDSLNNIECYICTNKVGSDIVGTHELLFSNYLKHAQYKMGRGGVGQ